MFYQASFSLQLLFCCPALKTAWKLSTWLRMSKSITLHNNGPMAAQGAGVLYRDTKPAFIRLHSGPTITLEQSRTIPIIASSSGKSQSVGLLSCPPMVLTSGSLLPPAPITTPSTRLLFSLLCPKCHSSLELCICLDLSTMGHSLSRVALNHDIRPKSWWKEMNCEWKERSRCAGGAGAGPMKAGYSSLWFIHQPAYSH